MSASQWPSALPESPKSLLNVVTSTVLLAACSMIGGKHGIISQRAQSFRGDQVLD